MIPDFRKKKDIRAEQNLKAGVKKNNGSLLEYYVKCPEKLAYLDSLYN